MKKKEDTCEEKITVVGYMCKTAWDYDIGNATEVCIYSSIDALRKKCRCADSCGIVEVEVKLNKVVQDCMSKKKKKKKKKEKVVDQKLEAPKKKLTNFFGEMVDMSEPGWSYALDYK